MNLSEFNSPLPKPWLAIKADTVRSRETGSDITLLSGQATVRSTIPANLTAAEVVNGIIAIDAGTQTLSGTIIIPTAAQLNSYIGNFPLEMPVYYFVCYLYLATGVGGQISLSISTTGTGVSMWDGKTGITFNVLPQNSYLQKTLIFHANILTGWKLYISD